MSVLINHVHIFSQGSRRTIMVAVQMSIVSLGLTALDALEMKVNLWSALLFPSETHTRCTVVRAIVLQVCSV